MALVKTVTVIDDIDGTEGAQTISFALEGVAYEIDLSDEHADELRDALSTYIEHGRRASGRRSSAPRSTGRTNASRQLTAKMREWARENGHQVSDRGRLSADIVAAYEAAH